MNKLYSIQALRGVASLLVLILHCSHKENTYSQGVFTGFGIGNIGVDIFFIISGFIMAYTTKPNLTAKKFLIKRCIRIVPLYWITLSFALIAYLSFPNLVNGGRTSAVISSFFLIPSNLPFLNQNAWTLSYEFVFYILFAISLSLWSKFLLLSTIFSILSLSAIGLCVKFNNPFLQMLTSSLMIEFIYGFFLYYFILEWNKVKIYRLLILCISIAITLIIFIIDIPFEFRFFSFGLPALCLCLVLVSCESFFKKYLSKLSSFIGDISYSLYLTHPFILSGVGYLLYKLNLSNNSYIFVFTLLMTSVVAAFFVYKYIENPLTKYFSNLYVNRNLKLA